MHRLLPAALVLALTATPVSADHWAFRPVADPPVPKLSTEYWVLRNPIDAFVRAKLSEAGLEPTKPADRRTLIRRATFDLTGLPPTPEEIDAFLADPSPDAFAKLIDRLLASPAYGERWGRHWLDVARYADSNGLDENIAHGNAWRYRDYVIQSFNADKPYDQFIREQIAGDLLPHRDEAERRDHLIATGFLALGPKVLAEVDERKMELDIVDEQVDTVGKAVMGLTLGCARCHDHKFDPVSMEDYYALAGVFLSTKTMESFKKIARWHENPLGTPNEIRRRADHDATVARLKETLKGTRGENQKQLRRMIADLEKRAPEVPSAMGVTEGTVADAPLLRRGNHLRPGDPVARRFPVALTRDRPVSLPADHSGRLELANWLTSAAHPLTARVMVNRVWRWHFGRGLVASTDNFGLLGDAPTHPELLDWLAKRFVEDGWSVKRLHKRIMLSETYQQASSVPHSELRNPQSRDPENRLFWRFAPRRLEAEAIRDSLLAVGGALDRTAGGPALTHVKNREFLFDHTSIDRTTYDSRRRSVYLPVIRNHQYDVFRLFDAPDPAVVTGDRTTTTVATQALFWLNSPLVIQAADGLAGRTLGRVDRVYELAYGRPPTDAEVKRFLAAARDLGDGRTGWARACQVVLAANEFVTVK